MSLDSLLISELCPVFLETPLVIDLVVDGMVGSILGKGQGANEVVGNVGALELLLEEAPAGGHVIPDDSGSEYLSADLRDVQLSGGLGYHGSVAWRCGAAVAKAAPQ